MANFSALKTAIQNAIKQNGNEEITGDVLQQILLSVVNAMGDGAINTIEQNLSNETLARQNGDNTLQSNINAEALARGNADTQLQNAVNAINTYLAKGYVYAGVATPTGTPVSGRVFYVATTAGRYTSFGNLQVQNGISILLVENGSWVSHQLLVVDLSLVQGSTNPLSGGAVYQAIQNEETERKASDEQLQNNINNENSRAVGAENGLHQEIVAERDARIEGLGEERDARRQEIQGMRDDVLDLIHEYRPIVIEGNVVNAPDEEDITQQPNNLLKFKDKDYNPTIFSGLGRKYLRKNIIVNEDYISFDGFEMNPEADDMLEGQPDSIFWDRLRERFIAEKDGVYYLDWQGSGDYIPVSADNIYVNENIPYFWNGEDLAVDDDVIARYGNILTQEMMSDANTIYVIQYDFTLGEDITVPANCVLEFNGGSINNGNITFDATLLCGDIRFENVAASGTILNESITPIAFGAKGDGVTNDTIAFKSAVDVCDNIYVPSGTYIIDCGNGRSYANIGIVIKRYNVHITMDSDTILKAGSLPSINPGNDFRNIISVEGPGVVDGVDTRIENFTLEGGQIIGARNQFILAQSGLTVDTLLENYCAIAIRFCNNVIIKDCVITDNTGDAIYTAAVDNIRIENVTAKRCRRCSFSIGLDNGIIIKNCYIENPRYVSYPNGNSSYAIAPYAGVCFEPEPAALRAISDAPIQNCTIDGCTFENIDGYQAPRLYSVLGTGCDLVIRNNIFKNVNRENVTIVNSNSTDQSYKTENLTLEHNTIYAHTITSSSSQSYFADLRSDGEVNVRDNEVHGIMLANFIGYKHLNVDGNIVKDFDTLVAHAYAKTGESDAYAIFKDNKGDVITICKEFNAEQEIYILNNFFTGKATNLTGVNSFTVFPNGCNKMVVDGNNITLPVIFFINKRYSDPGELLIKNNTVVFTGTPYWFDSNVCYVKADIIGNYFKTGGNRTLVKGDFTLKMNVINNVFAGSETKFTADTTDTDYLKLSGNVYLG